MIHTAAELGKEGVTQRQFENAGFATFAALTLLKIQAKVESVISSLYDPRGFNRDSKRVTIESHLATRGDLFVTVWQVEPYNDADGYELGLKYMISRMPTSATTGGEHDILEKIVDEPGDQAFVEIPDIYSQLEEVHYGTRETLLLSYASTAHGSATIQRSIEEGNFIKATGEFVPDSVNIEADSSLLVNDIGLQHRITDIIHSGIWKLNMRLTLMIKLIGNETRKYEIVRIVDEIYPTMNLLINSICHQYFLRGNSSEIGAEESFTADLDVVEAAQGDLQTAVKIRFEEHHHGKGVLSARYTDIHLLPGEIDLELPFNPEFLQICRPIEGGLDISRGYVPEGDELTDYVAMEDLFDLNSSSNAQTEQFLMSNYDKLKRIGNYIRTQGTAVPLAIYPFGKNRNAVLPQLTDLEVLIEPTGTTVCLNDLNRSLFEDPSPTPKLGRTTFNNLSTQVSKMEEILSSEEKLVLMWGSFFPLIKSGVMHKATKLTSRQ
jgi:hypothetical protein